MPKRTDLQKILVLGSDPQGAIHKAAEATGHRVMDCVQVVRLGLLVGETA